MAPKRKSTPIQNPLHSESSSSDPSVPSLHVQFCDKKAYQDFSENFSKCDIHPKHHVILSNFADTSLPDVIHTWGWESLCKIPLRCPTVFIQEFYSNMHGIDTSVPKFVTTFWGTHIVVTPDLISEILHVSRVEYPDYPRCQCLRTVSKDALQSHFYKTPSIWGKSQNTTCSGFAKGPRFLNMVMTFVLTPLSHYNFITEPLAWFLLSLLEDLSIDFPSHFILSLIDVYRDTATGDKLIFPSAITQILHHFSILDSPFYTTMGAISVAFVRRSEAQLRQKWPWTETTDSSAPTIPSTFASSSASGVSLKAIMAQL